ncbi:MAG TPA: superoxide dismutase family protein [Thermoanaerobaculia bacterium]|nr:superoxide dismutase family protein [Thermoanaerobaculia bacterium]
MKQVVRILPLALLLLVGCAHAIKTPDAMATLEPRSGSNATGTVTFWDLGKGNVRVKVDMTGIPAGNHGFHVHEKGDCSALDASSAGGHFNPTSMAHGAPDVEAHHAGDFGNVTADAKGEVHTTMTTRSITLGSGTDSVIGKALVLHADRDDLTTQPSGNAGKRIACGVVEMGAMAHSMH